MNACPEAILIQEVRPARATSGQASTYHISCTEAMFEPCAIAEMQTRDEASAASTSIFKQEEDAILEQWWQKCVQDAHKPKRPRWCDLDSPGNTPGLSPMSSPRKHGDEEANDAIDKNLSSNEHVPVKSHEHKFRESHFQQSGLMNEYVSNWVVSKESACAYVHFDKCHPAFINGVNLATKSPRPKRYVCSTWNCLQILCSMDPAICSSNDSWIFTLSESQAKNFKFVEGRFSDEGTMFLQDAVWTHNDLKDNAMVLCGIELAVNIHEGINRYEWHTPPQKSICVKEHLRKWSEIIEIEKTFQLPFWYEATHPDENEHDQELERKICTPSLKMKEDAMSNPRCPHWKVVEQWEDVPMACWLRQAKKAKSKIETSSSFTPSSNCHQPCANHGYPCSAETADWASNSWRTYESPAFASHSLQHASGVRYCANNRDPRSVETTDGPSNSWRTYDSSAFSIHSLQHAPGVWY